jgi:hypothetical protein
VFLPVGACLTSGQYAPSGWGVKVAVVTQPQSSDRNTLQPGGNLERFILDVIGRSALAKVVRQNRAATPRFVGAAGEAAFVNSWVNFDAAAPPTGRAAFYYKQAGRVHLSGVIKGGASSAAAFVLPSDCLPYFTGSDVVYPVMASGGVAEIDVRQDGSVVPINLGATAVTTFVFLDGVSFRAR